MKLEGKKSYFGRRVQLMRNDMGVTGWARVKAQRL